MTRDIKFRCWNKKLKCWGGGISINKYGVAAPAVQRLDVKRRGDVYEVMQYTGLKDRDGKEVYEGDIVKDPGKYPVGYRHDFVNQTAIVEFQTELGGWFINDRQNMLKELQAANSDKWQVIGNIYENPELLK